MTRSVAYLICLFMSMKAKKRRCSLSAELVKTAGKQLRMEVFLNDNNSETTLNTIPTFNKFAVLDHEQVQIQEQKNSQSTVEEAVVESTLPAEEALMLENNSGSENRTNTFELLAKQTSLVMETVLNIYIKLDQINITFDSVKATLNSLTEKLLSPPSSGTKKNLQANATKTLSVKSKPSEVPTSHKLPCLPNKSLRTISRRLQPKKLAMLIGNMRSNYNKWDTRRSIELSFCQILNCKRTDIDITDLYWMPSASFYKRIIVTFRSEKLPSLLMNKQSFLRNYWIFPTRVFADSEPLPFV